MADAPTPAPSNAVTDATNATAAKLDADEQAVRAAANAFLHDLPPDALENMPPEFRRNVPREAAAWRLADEGAGRVKLVAYPPGGVTATDRFFYEIHLQRVPDRPSDTWRVQPRIVSFVHAWAKR